MSKSYYFKTTIHELVIRSIHILFINVIISICLLIWKVNLIVYFSNNWSKLLLDRKLRIRTYIATISHIESE